MSPAFAIARRETAAAFLNRSFWFALAATAALACGAGAMLARLLPAAAGERPARLVEILLLSTPVLATALSAGSFARQRADGSLETLLSAPVSDGSVVVGKFLGAFVPCVAGTALLAAAALAACGPLGEPWPDAGETALAAVGIAAVAAAQAAWCSAGVFFSLFARRESGAAAATFAAALASAAVASGDLPFADPDGALARLDIVRFALGTADTRPAVAFVSVAAFFLFAATRLLESRHWMVSRND